MNKTEVSSHIFLYYESTGKYVLDTVSKFYDGPIYLSLIKDNCANDILINYARYLFDETRVLYVDNCGTDQYGFFHTFKHDSGETPWIFYCHDKHPSKMDWLKSLIEIYTHIPNDALSIKNVGLISSEKNKSKQPAFEELLFEYSNCAYHHRKDVVQSMHTLIWLHELERILLSKHNLGNKDFKCPIFSAGNIFLIRRDVVQKTHSCVYDEFFNKGVYRTDGEVEHGLERFYFYVSQCLGYKNLFI